MGRPGGTSPSRSCRPLRRGQRLARPPGVVPFVGERQFAADARRSPRLGHSVGQVKIPESTKGSLSSRLSRHAREHWPDLASVRARFRANFAYVDGEEKDGAILPLCRLRYGGYASEWGFAIYLASKDGYEDSVLPSGRLAGSPEEALDCACGLYLGQPGAWLSSL